MNNPTVIEATQIIPLKDQWLFRNNKLNPNLKIYLKKAKIVKQKH